MYKFTLTLYCMAAERVGSMRYKFGSSALPKIRPKIAKNSEVLFFLLFIVFFIQRVFSVIDISHYYK